jgi:hypothetical protein
MDVKLWILKGAILIILCDATYEGMKQKKIDKTGEAKKFKFYSTGCNFDFGIMRDDEPIFVDKHFNLIIPNQNSATFYDVILAICPKSLVSSRNVDIKRHDVICDYGQKLKFRHLSCVTPFQDKANSDDVVIVKETNKKCDGSKADIYEIGFIIESTFLPVIESCFDNYRMVKRVIYTKSHIYGAMSRGGKK